MLVIDLEKGAEFAKKAILAYRDGLLGDAKDSSVWKFTAPKKAKNKEEKFRFFFYILNVDYGMRAAKLFERARNFYDPKIFDPLYLSKEKLKKIEKMLSENLKLRFPKQGALRWKKNSEKIIELNGGSFSKFFSRKLTASEWVKEIKQFYGFGDKLARLLLRVLVDVGLMKKPEGFDVEALPSDIHDVKLAFRSGLLSGEEPNYSKHAKIAREAWTKACLKAGLSPMEVDKALWALGANFCYFKKCDSCPLADLCNKKFL